MLSQLRAVADTVATTHSVRQADVKQMSIEMASVMLGGMLLGRMAEGNSGRPAMAGVKWGFFYFLFQGVAHVTSVARETDDMYNEACGGAVAGGVFTLRGAYMRCLPVRFLSSSGLAERWLACSHLLLIWQAEGRQLFSVPF